MEALITQLADYGVVALILGISIAGNVYLVRYNRDIQDKRLKEAQENSERVAKLLENANRSMDGFTNILQTFVTSKT